MDFEALVSFWGKTWKASANASTSGAVADPSFKPVIHHLFDVAAVALAIQQSAAARLARDAEALEACPEALARTRAFLVGLHDLGKFSRAFQSLAPEHWPEEVLGRFEGAPSAKHWVLTGQILQTPDLDQILVELFPNLSAGAHAHIGFAVGGHHGQPPTAEQQSALTRRDLRASGMVGPECLSAAVHASRCLRGVLEPAPLGALKRARDAQRFSWSLAGLTTLADWVGSDAELFPFEPLETELDIYWATAQSRALEAIEQKGLRHAAPAEAGGLIKVFPAIANTPRPMQRTADELALPPGPMMAIIEDATGSGKTEAALALASRMIADGRAEGVFFALPTMATANAMFDRLRDAHKRLFVDKARPSLALAHGRSLLSEALA
ncbi:MAG: CRISPR-associated endonuclease Cas3'' [Pseudomonadota bacterium]